MAANDAELWCQNGLTSHGSSPPARKIGPRFRRPKQPSTPRQTYETGGAIQDQDGPRAFTTVPESQQFCESSFMSSEKLANHQHISSSSLGFSGVDKLLPNKTSLAARIEQQTQQVKGGDSLMASNNGQCLLSRETVPNERASAPCALPQQRVSSTWEKQHPGYSQGGPSKHRRSWHRQEQPLQNGSMIPVERLDRPRQRGAIGPAYQGQNHLGPTFPAADTHVAPAVLGSEFDVQTSGISLSFFEKNAFLEMWLKLEVAIESHERMLINMKLEMDKATSEVKAAKAAALKEKKEVEASKVGVIESLGYRPRQTDKIKCRREDLEQISTDLSVQVAELKCLLQQLQEPQRTLEVLESLGNHYKPSENKDNDFMEKNLQQCELKLATIEAELSRSRETSERLEQAALEKMAELKEIASSLSAESPGCHGVDLKRPKLEPVS